MPYRIALVGNPNCGKTTLFNLLTGSSQHVGNFPGVTVQKKEGLIEKSGFQAVMVDLPGIYSLSPYSPEETAAEKYLLSERPELIINLIDATSLERSLYLTLQLAEIGIPMVAALNMSDLLQTYGLELKITELGAMLKMPVCRISASKGQGIDDLLETAKKALKTGVPIASEIDPRDVKMTTAESRYRRIEEILERTLRKKGYRKAALTDRIDAVVLNRFFAVPLLIFMVAAVFFITFGSLGGTLSSAAELFIDRFSFCLSNLLKSVGAKEWITGLVCDGIFAGVGTVLSFLPQIALLFLLLSLLEDSGYMARAAFIMDRPMRAVGLSGKAFIPMLMGFGCSVPAVMSTRTLETERARKTTVFLIPFMSCSAKLPVYALMIPSFLSRHFAAAVCVLYFSGIIFACAAAALCGRFLKGQDTFFMELPDYRMPTLSSLAVHIWQRLKGFIAKAGTVLLLASIIVWFLKSFGTSFQYIGKNAADSLLAAAGNWIAPVFRPLGFGTWQAASALASGLIAKEAVVSTLGITGGIAGMFTAPSALSFTVFVLFYTPCVAALSAMARELGSVRKAAAAGIFYFGFAWILSFATYHTALVFY